MRTALSLVLLLLVSAPVYAACAFRKDVAKVISLSGPVTVLLREAGLLRHPAVTGISIFSPIRRKEFGGKIYPGGLFLARSALAEFAGGVVFYDAGRELRRILQTVSGIRAIEVNTRDRLPLEVIDHTIVLVTGVTEGCEAAFRKFRGRGQALQDELLRKVSAELKVVFFLGSFRGTRPPELVMANDGVVKLLRRERRIATYPSDLAYVNWSARLLASLPARTLLVGLEDSSMDGEKKLTTAETRTTVTYPGILVPGITQLAGLLYWARGL
jgi:hypothetical protein